MSISFRYLDLSESVDPLSGMSPEEKHTIDYINQKVASAASLDELMHFFYDATRSLFPCDRMSLAFVEEQGRRAVAHWTRSEFAESRLTKGFTGDIGGSSLENVVREGRPRLIGDLEAYLEDKPESESSRLLVAEGLRSSMTCPLMLEGRVVALLFRSSVMKGAYQEEHVRKHMALMERLAQAVEKAYRIEQLESANRAYMEMLGFVAHELKSPLASLQTVGRTLLDGYVGELSPEQKEKIGRMNAKAEGLLALVGEYLNLAWIESGEMEIQAVDDLDLEKKIFSPAVEDLEPQLNERGMILSVRVDQGPISLRGDPSLLGVVLRNLLGNAIKYGKPGGKIELNAARTNEGVHIRVFNEGPGFSPEDRDLLFKRFSRIRKPELMKQKGTGVGLYVSWRIVQAHGGRIWAESEPKSWARFHVLLRDKPLT
ncbi:MAG: GAF domain-containing sensor histidine kinase [Deltaproteobacteria bacterium]|nr:GAF domain-containing sensor histidine kinase [Deltaproteobacteria bacterium]